MSIKRIIFRSAFICFIVLSTTGVRAQFQGQITFRLYSEDDKGKSTSDVNLYATDQRIFIKGEESYSVSDGMFNASGLLVRNDKKDFIMLTGEQEALQFTKEELENMFNMFAMMDNSGSGETRKSKLDKGNYKYTNKTKKILGYNCSQLMIMDEEKPGEYVSLWLTPEIDIEWGMLAEPWKNLPDDMSLTINDITQEFKSRNFPLLVEAYKKGKTQTVMEVTKVNKSSVAKAMVEIPAGINLISLQQLMLKMMMQQR